MTTKLDRLIVYYLCFGIFISVVGLIISPSKGNIIRNLAHMYLPALSYLIARYYFSYSTDNIAKFTKIISALTILLIIDIFIEYLMIELKISHLIPWIRKGQISAAQLGMSFGKFENFVTPITVISVMAGGKTVALTIAALFCFFLPFIIKDSSFLLKSKYVPNKIIIAIKLICLVIISILLPSLASTLSLFFVAFIIILYNFKLINLSKIILFLTVIFVLIYLFRDFFTDQFIKRTTAGAFGNSSELEYIFNLFNTIEAYSRAEISTFIFGSDIINQKSITGHKSELTLLLMPLRYSIFWAFLISLILIYITKYFRFLVHRLPIHSFNRVMGFAFMGFFLVYMSNLHYPSFDLHGNIELFFIMAAALASTYEFSIKGKIV